MDESKNVEHHILNYLNQYNLDLRLSHNGRYIDQKLTPDVLAFIADCILTYIHNDINKEFSVSDIMELDYFNKNVGLIFGKPNLKKNTMENEYNKFVGQPIKTLAYAHILEEDNHTKPYIYKINNIELLEYIALREKNALNFLHIYLRKVFTDSGFIKSIDDYIEECKDHKIDEMKFQQLKVKYQKFIIGNTKITKVLEVNRIFPKVINIFSAINMIQGSIKGKLSEYSINYNDLMYNRINFRDFRKEKNMTRYEAADQIIPQENSFYDKYLMNKAVKIIDTKYKKSEVNDELATGPAGPVHHIFPKFQYPQLAHFVENLIKLTDSQHLAKAHPGGNTHLIDKEYQITCLMSKSHSIENSINNGEFLYQKGIFIYVLNSGFENFKNPFFDFNADFEQIRKGLTDLYKVV